MSTDDLSAKARDVAYEMLVEGRSDVAPLLGNALMDVEAAVGQHLDRGRRWLPVCRSGRMSTVEILHLAHREDWEEAVRVGAYHVSTRGAGLDEMGFIHASYPHQLAAVAESVHAGDEADLCVLVMDTGAVRAAGIRVVDEDGGSGELYPHIYGPIEPRFVTAVRPAGFDEAGRFRW